MTLALGVFLASLLGSVHCAAMCGGLVCAYSAAGVGRGQAGLAAHAAYHGGRLVSYMTLGAIAGAIGAQVNEVTRIGGFTRGAAVLAGGLMVLWAAASIAATLGIRVPQPAPPAWARRHLGAVLVRARDRAPVIRAGLTGLVTTLIPCGWLYTFVVAAGATGRAVNGAAMMATFWVGTVPVLLAIGLGAPYLLRGPVRRLPLVGATIVLALGMLSIMGRLGPVAMHGHH